MTRPDHTRASTRIASAAMAGHGVAYALSIVFARTLGVEGFEAYVVAAAAFVLMVNVAPLGLDKFALRLLPALFERGDWALAAGFLGEARRRILRASVVLTTLVIVWVVWQGDAGSATGRALIASALSLPAGALVQLLAGVVAASGGERLANLAVRVTVPVATLGLVGIVLAAPVAISGALAIACWGVAWVGAFVWLQRDVARRLPAPVLAASPVDDKSWGAQGRTFWAYGVALAVMGQAGVVALELLQPSASAVGAYAAATSTTGAFVATIAATNGVYARRLSVLLERRDLTAQARLRRERLRWLLPLLGVFLVIVFTFPAEILTLFRPEFVSEGVVPIRILAVAVSVTLVFALSPTHLKFQQRSRGLFAIVASCTTLQVVLLLALVPGRGATGAAVAYAVSTCVMYGAFAVMRARGQAGSDRERIR